MNVWELIEALQAIPAENRGLQVVSRRARGRPALEVTRPKLERRYRDDQTLVGRWEDPAYTDPVIVI